MNWKEFLKQICKKVGFIIILLPILISYKVIRIESTPIRPMEHFQVKCYRDKQVVALCNKKGKKANMQIKIILEPIKEIQKTSFLIDAPDGISKISKMSGGPGAYGGAFFRSGGHISKKKHSIVFSFLINKEEKYSLNGHFMSWPMSPSNIDGKPTACETLRFSVIVDNSSKGCEIETLLE